MLTFHHAPPLRVEVCRGLRGRDTLVIHVQVTQANGCCVSMEEITRTGWETLCDAVSRAVVNGHREGARDFRIQIVDGDRGVTELAPIDLLVRALALQHVDHPGGSRRMVCARGTDRGWQ